MLLQTFRRLALGEECDCELVGRFDRYELQFDCLSQPRCSCSTIGSNARPPIEPTQRRSTGGHSSSNARGGAVWPGESSRTSSPWTSSRSVTSSAPSTTSTASRTDDADADGGFVGGSGRFLKMPGGQSGDCSRARAKPDLRSFRRRVSDHPWVQCCRVWLSGVLRLDTGVQRGDRTGDGHAWSASNVGWSSSASASRSCRRDRGRVPLRRDCARRCAHCERLILGYVAGGSVASWRHFLSVARCSIPPGPTRSER